MNPIITDIDPKKLEELQAQLKAVRTPTFKMKNDLIKKHVGTCVSCYGIPTRLVTYDVGDTDMSAKKVERYCDHCFIRLRASNGIDETEAVRTGEPK